MMIFEQGIKPMSTRNTISIKRKPRDILPEAAAKLRIQRAYYLTNANGGIAYRNCEFAVISKRKLRIRKMVERLDISGLGAIRSQ